MPLPPGPISREQAQELMNALLQRAAVDAAFRARCLSDSRAAVGEVMELELPEEVTVVFVESAADGPGIVLPPFQAPEAPPAKPAPRMLNIKPKAEG